MFYVSLMVTTKQKLTLDTQKIREGGYKAFHYAMSSIHKGKQQEEERNKAITKHPEND